MASLIKKKRAKTYITSLIVNKKTTNEHQVIKDAFIKHFSNFYKSKNISQQKIENYLGNFKLKQLSEEVRVK